jgi:methionyl-tRNA synthetase
MKPTITIDDFVKLELRIGEILTATEPEWSRKLLEFTVDFGAEIGTKTILSGVRQWYKPEDFLGKKFSFVINLAERKMGEGVSQGMMMMADAQINDELRPVILPVDNSLPNGTVLR